MGMDRVRKAIKNVKKYIPGKTVEEIQRELGISHVVKLGSNENPYGPFPSVLEAMQQELINLNCYPDANFVEIKKLIGGKCDVNEEYIALSHGAEGVLQTISKSFIEEGDEVVVPQATYSLYPEISKVMGAKVINTPMDGYKIDLSRVLDAVTENTKLVWLCNPNNPTGTMFNHKEFTELLDKMPSHVWLVIDEAYSEFARKDLFPKSLDAVKEGKNLIVVRTFSKAYGLAGARLGYVIARPELIKIIDTVSEPFNANRIGIAGARAALLDKEYFTKTLEWTINSRAELESNLETMGFEVIPAETNFVFFQTDCSADEIAEALMHQGVIVRSAAGWGYPNALRVTVGKPEENEMFLDALKKVINKCA